MNSVVITGASSFIGRALCREMVSRGVTVYAVVRRYSDQIPKQCNQILCDMSDYQYLDRLLPLPCDSAIMLAWSGTRGADRNDTVIQQENYKYSVQCVEALLRAGCQAIVLAGSQAEYGPQSSSRKTDEETPLFPDTAYGKEKIHLYETASTLCIQCKVRLLEVRFFSIFGVGDFSGTMVISTLKKMIRDEPCNFTESVQMWDFLYVSDAARMTVDLLWEDAPDGAYNIGFGESRPLKEYILQMKYLTKSKSKLHFGAIPYRNNTVLHVQPDMSKTFSVIGKRKLITFEEGIREIIGSELLKN